MKRSAYLINVGRGVIVDLADLTAALQAGDYEKGLEHHLEAAALLNLNEVEVRASVVEQMLAQVRRLFASTSGPNTEAIHVMIGRVLTEVVEANVRRNSEAYSAVAS